jgi:hypothetical protein
MSHRLPGNGSRCPSNTATLSRRRTRPEKIFPLTANVKTLFRNHLAKHTKIHVFPRPVTYRMFHRLPVDAIDASQHRHPLTPKNPTGKNIPPPLTANVKTLFRNHLAKHTKIHVFPRPVTYRMFHRLPVDGNRCPSTPPPSDAEEPDRKKYSPPNRKRKNAFP